MDLNLDDIDPIVNRVEKSPLKTMDLAEFLPREELTFYDLKPHLFQEMILREKDFRKQLKETDFSTFKGKNIALGCTSDAIIPTWAYMLMITHLQPFASKVIVGTKEDLQKELIREKIAAINEDNYKEAKLVIKGCSDIYNPEYAFGEITKKLMPVASSIMYGEPCSTVPIYKKPKK